MKLSKPVEIRTVCLPEEITKYNLYPEISKTIDPIPDKPMFYMHRNSSKITSSNHRKAKSNYIPPDENQDKFKWLTNQISQISDKYTNSITKVKSDKPTTDCVATGWGRYTTHGPMTSTLLQVSVPLHDNSLCQAKYGNSIPIRTGHLCAGRLDGTTGTCVVSFVMFYKIDIGKDNNVYFQGDSGGPLQCSLKDGRWVLAGLTSFGSGCAKPGYPDVYTRLAFYIPWINKQINKYKDVD